MSVQDDVLDVAYEYLEHIKKQGNDSIVASCPFHDTDNPQGYSQTLSMSLTKGVYYCFSCGAKGNLHTLLRSMGVKKKKLRDRYGPILNELRNSTPHKQRKDSPSIIIPEIVLGYFDYIPNELIAAGFSKETLDHFDVGYDAARDRVTYPIRNLNGDLIALYGRRKNDKRKYMPYIDELKELDVTNVSSVSLGGMLWHANYVSKAMLDAPQFEPIVLTEGYKACMWVYQCGYPNVVHSFGTGVTEEQADLLSSIGTECIVMYDGDQAGDSGTWRAGRLLQSRMNVRIVDLIDGDQPDDLTPEEVEYVIDNALPYPKWKRLKEGKEELVWRKIRTTT